MEEFKPWRVLSNAYQRGQSEAEDAAAEIRALPMPERKEG